MEADAAETILLQPTRFKIALHLVESPEPEYIDQIAAAVSESSRLVAHHLELLEDLGLVQSEFRIIESKTSGRGFAGRFFTPLPKLTEALQRVARKAIVKRRVDRYEE
jgi:DNA-binding transcriptional ArsR family regulator